MNPRFVFVGPGGAGKSTLATSFQDYYQSTEMEEVALISENFRDAYQQTLEEYPIERYTPHQIIFNAQTTALRNQLVAEIENRETGFISDRSIFDIILYSTMYGFPLRSLAENDADKEEVVIGSDLWNLWKNTSSKEQGYNIVIYVPPYSDDLPKKDWFRSTDAAFVEAERKAFEAMYTNWKMYHEKWYKGKMVYKLNDTSLVGRKHEVISIYESVHHQLPEMPSCQNFDNQLGLLANIESYVEDLGREVVRDMNDKGELLFMKED